MKGGFAGLAARYYYPQNTLSNGDPQRDMTTSTMKGGCGCGMKTGGSLRQKNHSRKYLKRSSMNGGSGFFNNFGTTTGASDAARQVIGAPNNYLEMQKPAFLA